jgi:hypothetical protein
MWGIVFHRLIVKSLNRSYRFLKDFWDPCFKTVSSWKTIRIHKRTNAFKAASKYSSKQQPIAALNSACGVLFFIVLSLNR